jgi:DNA-binding transcriptional LysR family regulator
MRYFSAVCHAGNITRAAEELHISQPSVTASIKALEDELGVSLLHRGARAVTPTPDGERFLLRCDAILADVDSLSSDFEELSKGHKTINVGIPPMIGSIVFPEIFHRFRKRYPEIIIKPTEIGSQAAKEAVANGELDLAIVTMGEELSSRLNALRLTSYEMRYCVSPEHPLAGRERVSLRDVWQYPMIMFSGGYYQNHLLESRFKELDITPNVLFHSNQLTTIKSFIRQNIASGFLMPQILQPQDGIVSIPVREELILNVAVVWRKDDYLFREAERFVSFCRKTLETK